MSTTLTDVYENLLSAPWLVRLLVVTLPVVVILVALTMWTKSTDHDDRSNDNVMTAGIRFVGAAFIFIGSFANVTAWQGSAAAGAHLNSELSSLASLVESILDYRQDATLEQARKAVIDYVEAIRSGELASNPLDESLAASSGLVNARRTKNAALGAPRVIRDNAERAALDIRSAVIEIEKAGVVSERDINRMIEEVDDFQAARRDRISVAWPMVSPVVMVTLLVLTVAVLVLIGLMPAGTRRGLKRLQVTASAVVVSAVWFSVLSTQDLSTRNPAVRAPVDAFLNRYR
jgi:fumarate reductase subunit D